MQDDLSWLYGAPSLYRDIKSDLLYGMALASQGPILILHKLLKETKSFLTYVFWKQKTGSGKAKKTSAGCRINMKK